MEDVSEHVQFLPSLTFSVIWRNLITVTAALRGKVGLNMCTVLPISSEKIWP